MKIQRLILLCLSIIVMGFFNVKGTQLSKNNKLNSVIISDSIQESEIILENWMIDFNKWKIIKNDG